MRYWNTIASPSVTASSARRSNKAEIKVAVGLRCAIIVRAENIDAGCNGAREYAARITEGPITHHYGEQQVSATDFAGYLWTLSESIADVHPHDWGGTALRGAPEMYIETRKPFAVLSASMAGVTSVYAQTGPEQPGATQPRDSQSTTVQQSQLETVVISADRSELSTVLLRSTFSESTITPEAILNITPSPGPPFKLF
jgi:hypothetical protein